MKKKKSVMQELREIRDRISMETMDMSFEELKDCFARNSKIHDVSVWKTKYKNKSGTVAVAESKVKYGKNRSQLNVACLR